MHYNNTACFHFHIQSRVTSVIAGLCCAADSTHLATSTPVLLKICCFKRLQFHSASLSVKVSLAEISLGSVNVFWVFVTDPKQLLAYSSFHFFPTFTTFADKVLRLLCLQVMGQRYANPSGIDPPCLQCCRGSRQSAPACIWLHTTTALWLQY